MLCRTKKLVTYQRGTNNNHFIVEKYRPIRSAGLSDITIYGGAKAWRTQLSIDNTTSMQHYSTEEIMSIAISLGALFA